MKVYPFVYKVGVAVALLMAAAGPACSVKPEVRKIKYLEGGKKHRQEKDYARAILDFRNAISAAPKDPEPYYQLGVTFMEKGDVQEAANQWMKASKLDPKHAPTQIRLAELMAMNKDVGVVQEAEKRAKAIVAGEPDNTEALDVWALAALRLDHPELAEKRLEQSLDKFPKDLKSAKMLALIKLGRKDLAGAEQVLKRAAAEVPQSTEPALALGLFYLRAQKPAEAESQFRRVLLIDPKEQTALVNLGPLLYRTGRKDEAEKIYARIAALPNKEYRSVHAVFLFEEGRRDEAISELDKLVRADPEDRLTRTRLVRAYLALHKPAEAERVLAATLKRNPKDQEALLQRSELLRMGGRYGEAETDLNQVLHFSPDSAEAHYGMAKIRQAQGEPTRQRQELIQVVRINPNFLQARLELARLLTLANAAQAALELVDAMPEEQKGTIPAIVERNAALMVLGDKAELRLGIARGLAINKTTDLLLQDGILKLQEKNYLGARTSLEQVMEKNPDDVRALKALALGLVAQHQGGLALETVRRYASRRPQSAPMQGFLGTWLLQNGHPDQARVAFAAAKSANPNFTEADMSLAQLDIVEGKLDSGLRILTGVLSANPREMRARLLLGELEQQAALYPQAIAHFRGVLDQDPDNVVALNNLAYLLVNYSNQPDEGLKVAQQVKQLAPDNSTVDDTIGWAYYRKGFYPTALKYLEVAVARDSTAVHQYHFAMACFQVGSRNRGLQAYSLALKLDPKLPEAKMTEAVLLKQHP